jgi:hypothetical protein
MRSLPASVWSPCQPNWPDAATVRFSIALLGFGVVWELLGYQPVRGESAARCWLVSSSSAPKSPGGIAHPGFLMTVLQPAFQSADHGFTLARALARLGHRCVACSTHEGLVRAPVWFIRQSGRSGATTLVVVDLTATPMPPRRSEQPLQSVNDCVRKDRILVCERRHIVMGHARAAVAGTPADASTALDYHHFDATALHPDRT